MYVYVVKTARDKQKKWLAICKPFLKKMYVVINFL